MDVYLLHQIREKVRTILDPLREIRQFVMSTLFYVPIKSIVGARAFPSDPSAAASQALLSLSKRESIASRLVKHYATLYWLATDPPEIDKTTRAAQNELQKGGFLCSHQHQPS